MGKKKSDKNVRLKRVRTIQGSVSVLCLFLLGFAVFWAATNGFKSVTDDDSSEALKVAAPTQSSSAEASDDTAAEDSAEPAEASAPDEQSIDETPSESEAESGAQDYWDSITADESSVAAPVDTDESVDEPEESQEESQEDTPDSQEEFHFPTADEIDDDFADAVFIGNSRTVGLGMNCGKPLATFYASTGLNVQNLWWEGADAAAYNLQIDLDNGTKGSIFDALKQRQFKRVYVMFGINEIGWPSWDMFEEYYIDTVNKIKELQPDATIYVQSELPVSTAAVNNGSAFTPANVDALNERIKNVASTTGTVYVDVNSALRQEDGSLPLEASSDGIHMVRDYCMIWLKYLADNT